MSDMLQVCRNPSRKVVPEGGNRECGHTRGSHDARGCAFRSVCGCKQFEARSK